MFKEQWKRRIKLVEADLVKELRRTKSLDENLKQAMEYSLMAGGKRLRPCLLMAAAEATGSDGEKFIKVASAIEMIHTYSLIHDDLPAMDNDDWRRGKPTNHKIFGEATAILAGDALLTLAFEVIIRQPNVPHAVLLAVLEEISTAAGAAGMVGGQSIDLRSAGSQIDLSTLKLMYLGKTGALFRAAIRSGALLAQASVKKLNELTRYADAFGLAFQITDDILDVTGDDEIMGKATGSDEKNAKATFVSLTSIDEAKHYAQAAVDEAMDALRYFGNEADFLRELVQYLIDRQN